MRNQIQRGYELLYDVENNSHGKNKIGPIGIKGPHDDDQQSSVTIMLIFLF